MARRGYHRHRLSQRVLPHIRDVPRLLSFAGALAGVGLAAAPAPSPPLLLYRQDIPAFQRAAIQPVGDEDANIGPAQRKSVRLSIWEQADGEPAPAPIEAIPVTAQVAAMPAAPLKTQTLVLRNGRVSDSASGNRPTENQRRRRSKRFQLRHRWQQCPQRPLRRKHWSCATEECQTQHLGTGRRRTSAGADRSDSSYGTGGSNACSARGTA